jgi:hypothetical protein
MHPTTISIGSWQVQPRVTHVDAAATKDNVPFTLAQIVAENVYLSVMLPYGSRLTITPPDNEHA